MTSTDGALRRVEPSNLCGNPVSALRLPRRRPFFDGDPRSGGGPSQVMVDGAAVELMLEVPARTT